MYGYDWKPYVSVGQKKANACNFAAKVAKKQKRMCQPIQIEGRTIAKSFWGKAWCDHVVSLSDYANRLPRGRTYVRNGSVVDLVISPGKVEAIVAGSAPYNISISIKKLEKKKWESIKKDCSQSIDSLLDLLGGRLSEGVMQRLTDKGSGCFPAARQIEMVCDCPDWSACCKHLAAVMFGIGSRLDSEPELLFLLRGVNQEDLISQAVSRENLAQELQSESGDLAGENLAEIFGIQIDSKPDVKTSAKRSKPSVKSKSAPRSTHTRAKTSGVKKSDSNKAPPKTANAKKEIVKTKAPKKKVTKKKKAARKATTAKKKTTAKRKAATKKKGTTGRQLAKIAKKKSNKEKSAATKTSGKKKGSSKSVSSKKQSIKPKQPAKANQRTKKTGTAVASGQTKKARPKKRSR